MEHIPILVALISSHTVKDNMIKFIPDSVSRSDLFQMVSNDSHIIYLIVHNMVHQELYNLIHSYVGKHLTCKNVLFQFIQSLIQKLYAHIWKLHNDKFHKWEITRGITKKKKRQYRQHRRISDPSTHDTNRYSLLRSLDARTVNTQNGSPSRLPSQR
ncbi:hypothetical protein RirG_213420 [Rhizophagus irregularis DAOM 197198w]|nr:hypothetical protein RirG_213420 [Rhizophagus irregularis DAOM 197198w]